MLPDRMCPRKILSHGFAGLLLLILLGGASVVSAQDRSNGGLKGKVRVAGGQTASGISVTARQGEREIEHATT
ncbi:MAG: hypothetical protein LC754_16460, partial [Acidobacteria bacterium]|nr:hypothetical protein [Acidobacteriota bacterium]